MYSRLPFLGELRCAVAVIRRGDTVLLQERSDGGGWSFPGGVAWFWEQPEQTMRREIREETGMTVDTCRLLLTYSRRKPILQRIYVFAAEAQGEPRPSWEGVSSWQSLQPVPEPFFVPHRPVLSHLRDPDAPLLPE
ncbi:MAG TPA: NUDIX domain-containing protein [Terriglobales bacterium]|nr:NUDIX domain-containing protein [Terriglobales bacterium]